MRFHCGFVRCVYVCVNYVDGQFRRSLPFAKLNGWIFDLLGGTYIIIEDAFLGKTREVKLLSYEYKFN